MSENSKTRYIFRELRAHAPFTFSGAILGVLFMLIFRHISAHSSHILFNIFHPAHVLLSAIATTAMFRLHSKKQHIVLVILVGYVGSIGIATLSDSIIPFIGEVTLGFRVSHHEMSQGRHEAGPAQPDSAASSVIPPETDHSDDASGLHIGFLETPYIVNGAALLGIFIACFLPNTKFPHAGHVLLSIWASLFHIMMAAAFSGTISLLQWLGVVAFLFLAVWLPCCISDIVFPLLFVKPGDEMPEHTH